MSKVIEVRLRIKLAANSKMIEVKASRTRLAPDSSGDLVRLTKNHVFEIVNSVRSLEDFLYGVDDEFVQALDCKYFRMRFNVKELHAMLGRLEEINIHADLDKKVWRVTTHNNGSFRVTIEKVNNEEAVAIENIGTGYNSCIRNITSLVRKDVAFAMDLPAQEETLQTA